MSNTKHSLSKKFTIKSLSKTDLQKIKGGKKHKESKEEKEARKRCEKAWKDAEKQAKAEGRRIKRINGNGNGIW
ncbi:MAG: hypothetical protein AB8F94_14920 [Saprospiraceae bacterium]